MQISRGANSRREFSELSCQIIITSPSSTTSIAYLLNGYHTYKVCPSMIKRKSTVWNVFDRKNKDEARCDKCDKIMKTSGRSSTSLILHLKKIHQIDINQDANQPPVKMTRKMEHFLRKKSMEEEVSKLAAMGGFSFNSITKSNFIQRNLHSQRGKYDKLQPTSANGVRNMVMNYYITKKELIHYFEKEVVLEIRYSLTLAEYTSIQNKRYMNINFHGKDNH
ncbi:BED-type domain-containing protein [Octopus vulgaris]|uniref:BED-type domain-containing protein n=1 Tax=Octopus vulgaris TaxID=6645 RepID=A0AA36EZT0_OCTVU|nr:BED-type domain-containing protein [Octopus vulgaris]